jgi:hypothetical protein
LGGYCIHHEVAAEDQGALALSALARFLDLMGVVDMGPGAAPGHFFGVK